MIPLLLLFTAGVSSALAQGVDLNRIARAAGLQVKTAVIVEAIPHDTTSFTQGLFFHAGSLYESTGLYGQSKLRRLDPRTGGILDQIMVPPGYFAEGVVYWKGQVLQLTWQEHTAFIYRAEDFERTNLWVYDTEGWGITCDGMQFIMSDGSDKLQFRSTEDFTRTGTVNVTLGNARLSYLNELEFVNGRILANLLGADHLMEIDPRTGQVTAVVDASELRAEVGMDIENHPLNGIAYDSDTGDFYLTGKRWPAIFRVQIEERPNSE